MVTVVPNPVSILESQEKIRKFRIDFFNSPIAKILTLFEN